MRRGSRIAWSGIALAAALVSAAGVRAEGPAFLVRDISTRPTPASAPLGSDRTSFIRWGEVALFAARDVDGTELWRSDGTAAGTWRVKDLVLGAGSGNPVRVLDGGSVAYFVATTPTSGQELSYLTPLFKLLSFN